MVDAIPSKLMKFIWTSKRMTALPERMNHVLEIYVQYTHRTIVKTCLTFAATSIVKAPAFLFA